MTTYQEIREAFKRNIKLPSTKLDYWTFRKLRALKTKAVGNEGWEEYFKYLTRDVNLEPSIHERVQEGTQQTLLEDWMLNFANNLPFIRYGDDAVVVYPENYHQQSMADLLVYSPLFEFEPEYLKAIGEETVKDGVHVKNAPAGSAVVVGRGPSLFKNKHLEMLAEAQRKGEYQGIVVCSDGGFIPALEAGVKVHTVVTVDGAPIIKKYFDHQLVRDAAAASKINWLCSVTIHHEVYQTGRKAGLETYWFNPMFDDWRQNESWTRLQRLLSCTDRFVRGIPAGNSGGNSGACAWIMAMSLLKRAPIALIGIDFGYPEGTPLEKTQYYSSMLKQAKGDVKLMKEAYKEFYHPTFKTKAYVDLVFYHYRQAFLSLHNDLPLWYKTYGGTHNCTEGGTLFGPEIKCETFKQFLGENKT